MLSDCSLETILTRIPSLAFGVLGDLFLDRYLDIDATLTEPSIETGLDAYQVFRVRSYPGAAGTVINNLAALGAKRICAVSVIGDDGEGYELRQALHSVGVVDSRWVFSDEGRRTPTYTKPMAYETGKPARELNRLDIKNRSVLLARAEQNVLGALDELWPTIDALLVIDQVSEADCGVVTTQVREQLAELGGANPHKLLLADSRERIGLFRSAWLKPNVTECRRAARELCHGQRLPDSAEEAVRLVAEQAGRPLFCTCGEQGIWLADPRVQPARVLRVPAYPVAGPIDVVGAGDSTSAGIACAVAAGADLAEAASFGNLIASITIQQIGVTGTASPEQVRRRWQEVRDRRPVL